ncbi:MAG TPA: hypothetical protein VEY32_10705 [Flavisolibacter sp.]|nr:hypothetical protein [Flavisolibacter sp.]
MVLDILIFIALTSGAIGIVSYFLYARSRMKDDYPNEKFYKKLSDNAMLLLCILGIVIMIIYAQTSD